MPATKSFRRTFKEPRIRDWVGDGCGRTKRLACSVFIDREPHGVVDEDTGLGLTHILIRHDTTELQRGS